MRVSLGSIEGEACDGNSSSAPCTSNPKAFQSDDVKSINIFKAGTHTSAGGTTLDFSDDVLQASASAYDPAIHEAPMVIGHPADNGPAFGWIASLSYAEGELHADPDQVDGNYNYNANSVLANAIRSGQRGAYWDILRRGAEE